MEKKTLRDWLRSELPKPLLAAVLLGLGGLLSFAGREIWPLLENQLSRSVLWSLLAAETVVLVGLGTLLWILWNPLKTAFGMKWDKRLNPHCPTCDKPSQALHYRTPARSNERHVVSYCNGCNRVLSPFNGDGERFTEIEGLKQALKQRI